MPEHGDAPRPALLARHRRGGGAHVEHRRVTGVHRADGLAGPTQRYLFIVMLLASTSSMPILAVMSAGSATTLGNGLLPSDTTPFIAPQPDAAPVVVPLAPTALPSAPAPAAGLRTRAVPPPRRSGVTSRSQAGRPGERPRKPGGGDDHSAPCCASEPPDLPDSPAPSPPPSPSPSPDPSGSGEPGMPTPTMPTPSGPPAPSRSPDPSSPPTRSPAPSPSPSEPPAPSPSPTSTPGASPTPRPTSTPVPAERTIFNAQRV